MAANRYAGTKTEKNLWEAFAGESQARNKYTFFASVAKKAGYEQIAALFQKTADNEREHAKLWFRQLGQIGTTEENLAAAAAGENYAGTRPARRHDGHRIAPGKSLGWRSGSPKAHPHHPRGTSHDGRTESP